MQSKQVGVTCVMSGAIVAMAMAGCAIEGEDASDGDAPTIEASEATSETAQSLDWLTTWSWGTPGNAGPDKDIGSTSDRTCFLTGVVGSLKGYPGANGTPLTTARAGVYARNGRWVIETRAGDGPGVSAQVACIAHTANRAFLSVIQTPDSSPTAFVADQPNRRCFLTDVSAHGHGWAANLSGWPFGPPGAQIAKESTNWVLRRWLNPNSDGSSAGGAGAVCVDVPATGLGGFTWEAPSNGSFTKVMFDNDGSWACGLTGLFGVFMDSWSAPGASVFVDANGDWDVTIANSRQVKVACVQ